MKRNILWIGIIVLFIFTNSIAQTKYGVKAGSNISKYSISLPQNYYNYKIGFYLGGYANFQIDEKIKIQPELLFTTHGANFVIEPNIVLQDLSDINTINDEFKSKITESVIAIPVVSQFYLTNNFYLEAGPQFGFIISRNEKVIESVVDDPEFNSVPNSDYDVFDFGLVAGLGFDINENLSLNSRYFFGLIERDFLEVKSSVFYLGLEYEFKLNK